MEDRKVSSMNRVNFSSLRLPAIAVHENPSDYPGKFMARIFDADIPTNIVMVKDTLEELQHDIRQNTNMVFFTRGTEDVESMIGAWV